MSDNEAAAKAITYLLNRIQTDANAFYYCGPGTETFRLLCLAEAEATSEAFEDVERGRKEFRGKGKPDVERLRDLLDQDDWSDEEEIDPPPPPKIAPIWHDCGDLGRWATNGHLAVREGEPAEDRDDWRDGVDMAGFLRSHAIVRGPSVVVIDSSRKMHGDVEVVRVERADSKSEWFATEYLDRFSGCSVYPTGVPLACYVCKRGDVLVGVLMPRRVE